MFPSSGLQLDHWLIESWNSTQKNNLVTAYHASLLKVLISRFSLNDKYNFILLPFYDFL